MSILPKETRGDSKSKNIAIILAISLGLFGGHKFYLGEYKSGMLYAAFFWTLIPGFAGFFDAIRYFLKSDWEEYLDSTTNWEQAMQEIRDRRERKQKRRERWRNNRDLVLVDKYKSETGILKIEEWSGGSSVVDGSVDIDGSSKGKSRGVSVGLFSASRSNSSISAEGDISATISDNSFLAEINSLALLDDELRLRSDEIDFEINVLDIGRVYRTDSGIVVEADGTTFRMDGLSTGSATAVRGIESAKEEHQPDEQEPEPAQNSNGELSEKLEELQELNDSGVLSDEEFKDKKGELLNEY